MAPISKRIGFSDPKGRGGERRFNPRTGRPLRGGISSAEKRRRAERERKIALEQLKQKQIQQAKDKKLKEEAIAEKRRILKQKSILLRRGGRIKAKTAVEKNTGKKIDIIETRKGGRLVREIRDKETGIIKKITLFAPGSAGGSVGFKAGVATKIEKIKEDKKEKQKVQVRRPVVMKIKKDKLSRLAKVADFVTGGSISVAAFRKRQADINRQSKLFNARFGNKELSETEYAKAQFEKERLNQLQKNLDSDARKFEGTLRGKIGKIFDIQKDISGKEAEARKKLLPKKEKELSQLNKKIKSASKNKTTLSKINVKRLNLLKKAKQNEIRDIKAGKAPKILKGDLPIIPSSSIPSGVTAIKFVGAQRVGKNGRILTKLVFRTSRGREGVAYGVTVNKGKKTASVVLGRSGRKTFKLPSGKKRLDKMISFAGAEVGKAVPSKTAIASRVKVLKGKKAVGRINLIKKNIDVIRQQSVGKVIAARGKKVIKKRKRIKGITPQEFASLSEVLTKKDLSLIVGKTITRDKARAQFIGVIKGVKSSSKGFKKVASQQQFQKAYSQVASQAAAALAKASKQGFTGKERIAAASQILSKKLATKAPTKTKTTTVAKTTLKPRVTKIKSRVALAKATKQKSKTKAAQKSKTTQRLAQKKKTAQKSKAAQRTALRTRAKQKAVQKVAQKSRTRARQRTILRTKLKGGRPRVPTIPKVPRIPKIIAMKTKASRVTIIKKKKGQAYDVYAKPVRGKKLIKVNKKPLTKTRAEDVRNYIIDTSLSASGKIKATKGKPKRGIQKVPIGYGRRTSKKFRGFKKVKGVKKQLTKGRVIEKRGRRLDTKQEVKKITLRKRIKQITPKRKVKKRKGGTLKNGKNRRTKKTKRKTSKRS